MKEEGERDRDRDRKRKREKKRERERPRRQIYCQQRGKEEKRKKTYNSMNGCKCIRDERDRECEKKGIQMNQQNRICCDASERKIYMER